ncbi:hypothetical protein ABLI39_13550 [Pseudarthrobacter sp. B907]
MPALDVFQHDGDPAAVVVHPGQLRHRKVARQEPHHPGLPAVQAR